MSPDRDSGATPYFFLSYARTPKHDPNDRTDPDQWVYKLYSDLCKDILALTSAGPRSAGFMDRENHIGSVWPDRLAQALASCRVFVPLYSPRYFQSENCGREWFAFTRRMLNHRAHDSSTVSAIVPALWVGVDYEHLPDVARAIQFDHQDMGPAYKAKGFYEIIKLGRYREDYKRAVLALARRIVAVAQETRVGPEDPPDYESLESAFPAGPGRRQVRITVVAPEAKRLPAGRSSSYYGGKPDEWKPYGPSYTQPIAEYATALVTSCLGCPSAVSTLDNRGSGPGVDAASEAPGLFLIDAWAIKSPSHRASLRRIDALEQPWVSVMLPWNSEDAETAATEKELRQGLNRHLGRILASVPGQCRMAAEGIPTLPDFGYLLPKITMILLKRFLKETPETFPPPGERTGRPRLSVPELDNPGELS
jgi:FxsC-like protein